MDELPIGAPRYRARAETRGGTGIGEGDVVGRAAELDAVHRFVESDAEGPRALVLEGQAGIGKTTLWRAGLAVARRREMRLLQARPLEGETTMGFAALGDLLEGIAEEVTPELPEPQRHALEVALLRRSPEEPVDLRAVGVAVRGTLAVVAATHPVLLAIDDAQWLDVPTARALAFALRRVESLPIAVLATLRMPASAPVGLAAALDGRVERIVLEPFAPEQLPRVLAAHGITLPRPLLRRVHELSGGNPFFALELGRAAARDSQPAHALALPEQLAELVQSRIASLPEMTRTALLAVSASPTPTRGRVAAAVGGDAAEALAPALRAGVVEEHEGSIRFTHPILAAAAYSVAPAEQRRSVHQTLAALSEEPEERVRHRALAARHPDADLADALEDAARRAEARGATDDAAFFRERAAVLTPAAYANDRVRRRTDAAVNHAQAGDLSRARVLLEDAVRSVRRGRSRARPLYLLARISFARDYRRAIAQHEQALAEAADDPALVVSIERTLAGHFTQTLEFRRVERHARASLTGASRLGDPVLLASALTGVAMADFARGRGPRFDLLREAVRLEPPHADGRLLDRPSQILAARQRDVGAFDRSRVGLERLLSRAVERGEEESRERLSNAACLLECMAANFVAAERHANLAVEVARQLGGAHRLGQTLARAALVDVYLGRTESARGRIDEAEALLAAIPVPPAKTLDLWNVRGFLDMSLGNFDAAAQVLGDAVARMEAGGAEEPALFPRVPELVEALVSLGRLDEARRYAEAFQRRARTVNRLPALATAARSLGLMAGAAGDFEQASACFAEARTHHRSAPMPFEHARTLLALGTTQRRAKKRRAARETLEAAIAEFEALGTALWAEKAGDELGRISGRRALGPALTPSEERIARLVASGRTNREVASELFVTVKTVEGTLSRIYGKLGVRSRTELAVALNADGGSASRPAAKE